MSKICCYSWYQQQDVCLHIYYYIFIEDVLLIIVELGLVFEKLQILLRVQIVNPLKIRLWAVFAPHEDTIISNDSKHWIVLIRKEISLQ